MSPQEYQKQVLVTENRNFSNQSFIGRMVTSLYNKVHKGTLAQRYSDPRNIRLNHSAKGTVTEIGELFEMLDKPQLDFINLKEEVGDATFYMAIATDELSIDLASTLDAGYLAIKTQKKLASESEQREEIIKILSSLTQESAMFLDLMKKGIFYGREIPKVKIESLISDLMKSSMLLLNIAGFTIEQSFDANINKLQKKRYATGKFTENEAINRNIGAERAELEKKN